MKFKVKGFRYMVDKCINGNQRKESNEWKKNSNNCFYVSILKSTIISKTHIDEITNFSLREASSTKEY